MSKNIEERQQLDTQILHRFGYAQELARRMSGFSTFALAFMIIGIYWATALNIQQGISSAGLAGITIIFVVGCVVAISTAASLGEISSAIPTAGGIYHWSSMLGGRGWGWATAWVNLLAYVFSVASIAVSVYLLFNQMILGWIFNISTASWGYWTQLFAVILILASWGVLNHVGVRLLAKIANIGAYVTFAGAVMLLGLMLLNAHPENIYHIFDFKNMTGAPGGNVVPHTKSLILVFGYAFLLPMWMITSYDAAAHTSEETMDAARAVPKAMFNSALFSAAVGLILFLVYALAMVDPAKVAAQGGNAFTYMYQSMPAPAFVKDFIPVTMLIAAYICGACTLTGCSRAVFAFSRDGGLPRILRKVSIRHRTPASAVWFTAVLCVAVTLYSSAFNSLVAGTALFYQMCYGMAILAAFFAKTRTYGPFRLGVLSKPLNVIGVCGGVFLIWVGLQPPTQVLRWYFAGILLLLLVGWFAIERRRFPGPPMSEDEIRFRQAEIKAEEIAVGEMV